jgi:hypothetical protein
MVISISDEEWDELSPENFDTTALLRAVDAIDEMRNDLNDSECRYLVKDFGTSQSPKSTRLRDNLCAPAALRSALDSTNTRRAQHRPQMA